MVNHHGKGQAVNTEANREFLKSILDPNSTMFEGFSGYRIQSTKPRPMNRSLDGMKSTHVIWSEISRCYLMFVEFAKLWAIHFGGTNKAQEYENQTKRVCESGRSGGDSWGIPRNAPKLGGSRKDADAQKPGQRVPAI